MVGSGGQHVNEPLKATDSFLGQRYQHQLLWMTNSQHHTLALAARCAQLHKSCNWRANERKPRSHSLLIEMLSGGKPRDETIARHVSADFCGTNHDPWAVCRVSSALPQASQSCQCVPGRSDPGDRRISPPRPTAHGSVGSRTHSVMGHKNGCQTHRCRESRLLPGHRLTTHARKRDRTCIEF